jgi:hypothetical protein
LQIVKGNSPFESTVSILHDTFKQFIMSKDEKSVAAGGAREFFITPNEAEQKLAVACISYLSPIIIEYEASFHFFYKVAPFLPIEYPLFSYSTLYWSEHLSVINTGELSGAIQERLSTSLLRFLTHRNLCNWISSVMAFTARVTNSPLYNPLALSITSSLERASDWVTEEGYICTSSAGACIGVPSHFEDTKRVEDLQAVDTWRRRCAAAAAEAWLRSHPLWWESGIGCFKITSALYVHSRTDFALTNKAEMISLLEGLVEDSGHLTEFECLTNRGLGFDFVGLSDSARECFASALAIARNHHLLIANIRLADNYMKASHKSQSLKDANLAVNYAQAAFNGSRSDQFYELTCINWLARCFCSRAALTTTVTEKLESMTTALRLCKEGIEYILAADRDSYNSEEKLVAENIELISSERISTVRSRSDTESIKQPLTLQIVLNFLEIIVTLISMSLVKLDFSGLDLQKLISLCKNTISKMPDQNALVWLWLRKSIDMSQRIFNSELPDAKGIAAVPSDTTHCSPNQLMVWMQSTATARPSPEHRKTTTKPTGFSIFSATLCSVAVPQPTWRKQ